MITSRLALPVLLYFYQGDLTQDDADKVLDAFKDKDVHFRKVTDINDTRDIVERCTYVSGTVPLIYFVRKAADVMTGGVLADPLGRTGATSATTKKSDGIEDTGGKVTITTGHVQPTDAAIAADLLKEEIEQVETKTAEPDIKADDVKVDENATTAASSVTGQLPAETAQKAAAAQAAAAQAAPAAAPAAPAAPKPATAPKAPTK